MSAIPLNFWFAAMMDTLARVEPARSIDQRDVDACLHGDEDAYRRLIERHQGEIARRLRKFSRDPRMIEEMVHDTFVEAYFGLKSYRGDAPFIHWLHRIAVRVGYRFWKERKKHAGTAAIDGNELATPRAADSGDVELLEQVLDQLSPRDRLVVTLMYLEERSVEETAELTGWSRTMVKVQAFRARGRLRKMMEARNSR